MKPKHPGDSIMGLVTWSRMDGISLDTFGAEETMYSRYIPPPLLPTQAKGMHDTPRRVGVTYILRVNPPSGYSSTVQGTD